MSTRPSLQLRTAQSLSLTPQLQQSIRLLQLSTLEMQQELAQMLADNPFLECDEDTDAPPDVHGQDTQGQDAGADDYADATQDPLDDEGLHATTEVFDDDGASFATVQSFDDNWNDGTDNAPGAAVSDVASDWSAADADLWDGMHTAHATGGGDTDDTPITEREGAHVTLQAHLHQQALALRLEAEDRAALHYLIESLDDDGYLQDSLSDLAHGLLAQQNGVLQAGAADEVFSQLLHHFTVALYLLQTLEPAGVGARSLAECLQLQLQALPIASDDAAGLRVRAVALAVCSQPLDYLARRDVRGLSKRLPYAPAQIAIAMQRIATLEPKPGRRFAEVERQIIVPDVLVHANRGRNAAQHPWRVVLNPAVMPRVRVQEMYASVLRQHKGEGAQALQQRLQEARWMVKSIQQRFDTILRVSAAIVERQQRFFAQGALAMEPLVLREIADGLGLHESTVSRVTSAKYMLTPWGTFELKYFFASGLNTENGHSTSSTAVRAMIEQLVAAESPKRPLSDQRLCELLQQQGVQCARRTVAKYREAMRIPSAYLRKRLG